MADRVRGVLLMAAMVCSAVSLRAQNADSLNTAKTEEVLTRVRRYSGTDVALARALADSLVSAQPAGASAIPEALFAKATIAPSAAAAERDYSRIVEDFPFSARVPDALMRLAVLESARNNRVNALRHLDRLLRNHSDSPARSRASLLAGRLRLEAGDPARGCEALAAAYASAGPTERDVREQSEQLGAKCPTPIARMADRDPTPMGVKRAPAAVVAPAPVVAAGPATRRGRAAATPATPAAAKPATAVRRDSAPTTTATRPATVRRDSAPVVAVAKPVVPRRDSAPAASATRPAVVRRDSAPTTVVAKPTVRRDTAPVAAKPATPAPTPAATPTPAAPRTPAAAPAGGARYAVQFAAFPQRPGAEQYAAVLRGRGIAARVEGSVAPFRVRAGRYATSIEAEAAAAVWRKPGTAAIVVTLAPAP